MDLQALAYENLRKSRGRPPQKPLTCNECGSASDDVGVWTVGLSWRSGFVFMCNACSGSLPSTAVLLLPAYTLHKHPVQLDTLAIVQYLHSSGVRAEPARCVERCHPEWVTELPAIEVDATSERFVGLDACVRFYERASGEAEGMLARALAFKAARPEYRVHA